MSDMKNCSRSAVRVAALKSKSNAGANDKWQETSTGFLKRSGKVLRRYPIMFAGIAALFAFCSAIWMIAVERDSQVYKPTPRRKRNDVSNKKNYRHLARGAVRQTVNTIH